MSLLPPLFVANWKMNLSRVEAVSFAEKFLNSYKGNSTSDSDVWFSPSFTSAEALISSFNGTKIKVGAQNVHWEESGAFTGEISVKMLLDLGLSFSIIGHSERREYFGETDESASKRASACIKAGLTAIVCVGETKEQFEANQTEVVVAKQLSGSLAGIDVAEVDKLVIAYEPVWAIGTGLAATAEIADKVHNFIRAEIVSRFEEVGEQIKILYGGSTKPQNVSELVSLDNVNGALVGGASLKPDVFYQLIENGRQ